MKLKYAVLKRQYFDVPQGTEVIVISRFYGGIEGKCYVHVEPHPADKNCDWSTISGVEETDLSYTGKIWNDHTQKFEFEI